MLIKFFPNGKGAGAGPAGYLVAREVLAYDANRDLIRDADGYPHVSGLERDGLAESHRHDQTNITDFTLGDGDCLSGSDRSNIRANLSVELETFSDCDHDPTREVGHSDGATRASDLFDPPVKDIKHAHLLVG
ncbi:hypothetical protein [Ruegeria sp. THAF33]|uniref:hypothetical protein n=1 Tax=Ruegeria sp. THAF33 TaxID=2587853 RepID=UPI0012692926|nr:hypothetical protein [Ruegeria sp. THAF33]QFT74912.1 hypothetical protein FIU92_17880 [Ruegeria sp. THAF33]